MLSLAGAQTIFSVFLEMMNEPEYFVDVVIPLAVEGTYTYHCRKKDFDRIQKGIRVAVPFGKHQVQTGIVYNKHRSTPPYETKSVYQIIDDKPVISERAWELYEFISEYYLTPIGQVIRTALPHSFFLESRTFLKLNDEATYNKEQLPDDAWLIVEALEKNQVLSVEEIGKITGNRQKGLKTYFQLLEDGIVEIHISIRERYKPKYETYLLPASEEKQLKDFLNDISGRAYKQRELLLFFFKQYFPAKKPVNKKILLQSYSGSLIKALVDKGILKEIRVAADRQIFDEVAEENIQLNPAQKNTVNQIQSAFEKGKPVLLHGITASGKTEIYMKLIEKVLENGGKVLFLVPEIALTTQLILRLRKKFNRHISVYHSKYSLNERHEIWHNVLNHSTKTDIILGTRSALFLPYSHLDLIIVDEEHDEAYKEFFHQPFYQARDMALVLSRIHQAHIVLGTATPSVESYRNAETGKYALVEIFERHYQTPEPEQILVNLAEHYKQNKVRGHFSHDVLDAVKQVLDEGRQVLVFLNRRGYAPVVECKNCGHIDMCPNCSVSLTYHRQTEKLTCHYCRYSIPMTGVCRACGSNDLELHGTGTQQIAAELAEYFPDISVGRMDADTTGKKDGHSRIINRFETGEYRILVGTQMITKGLDFGNVSLVVVVNADRMLHYPDFRANERAFQMLTQVAGRTGRRDRRDRIMIQTYQPGHPVLQFVLRKDYQGFYRHEISERRQFRYPPFNRLVKLEFKAKNPQLLNEASEWLAKALRYYFPDVLGPSDPPVFRIKTYYLKEILIKFPADKSLKKSKTIIGKLIKKYKAIAKFRSVRLAVNPDP